MLTSMEPIRTAQNAIGAHIVAPSTVRFRVRAPRATGVTVHLRLLDEWEDAKQPVVRLDGELKSLSKRVGDGEGPAATAGHL